MTDESRTIKGTNIPVCDKHKRYQAITKPVILCKKCLHIFKQRQMGMTGISIMIDAGWLSRVTDNFMELVLRDLANEELLKTENDIVLGDAIMEGDE